MRDRKVLVKRRIRRHIALPTYLAPTIGTLWCLPFISATKRLECVKLLNAPLGTSSSKQASRRV